MSSVGHIRYLVRRMKAALDSSDHPKTILTLSHDSLEEIARAVHDRLRQCDDDELIGKACTVDALIDLARQSVSDRAVTYIGYDVATLKAIVDELPHFQRSMLELSIAGCSSAAIAEHLQVAPDIVTRQLSQVYATIESSIQAACQPNSHR